MSNMVLGSQRHTKLTSAEAALLAGELTKPSWESRNEGIHERVSFEDSIWGFDLAGGLFYKTPLRVTAVKKGSRAEKAGIRPGDQLLRINDVDTSTLTIQDAHTIIIESGIHIRLAVSAPDDAEDSYGCYQDPIEIERELERQRKIDEEKRRRRITTARVNQNWSLQWPWVSKRRIIYKESNCFMVPSKYEGKHRDKFSEKIPRLEAPDDIVLHSTKSDTPTAEKTEPNFANGEKTNGDINNKFTEKTKNDSENPETPANIKNETLKYETSNGEIKNETCNGDIDNFTQAAEPSAMDDQEVYEAREENEVMKESEEITNEDEELENCNINKSGAETNATEELEEMINDGEDLNDKEENRIRNESIAEINDTEDLEEVIKDDEDLNEEEENRPNESDAETDDIEELKETIKGDEDFNEEELNKIIDDVLSDNIDCEELESTNNEL